MSVLLFLTNSFALPDCGVVVVLAAASAIYQGWAGCLVWKAPAVV